MTVSEETLTRIKFHHLACVYVSVGMIASGHFMAHSCVANINDECSPVLVRAGMIPFIAATWPVYASFVAFDPPPPKAMP